MNKKDKLLKRFYSLPKDFTFDEIVSVFFLLWVPSGKQRINFWFKSHICQWQRWQ